MPGESTGKKNPINLHASSEHLFRNIAKILRSLIDPSVTPSLITFITSSNLVAMLVKWFRSDEEEHPQEGISLPQTSLNGD